MKASTLKPRTQPTASTKLNTCTGSGTEDSSQESEQNEQAEEESIRNPRMLSITWFRRDRDNPSKQPEVYTRKLTAGKRLQIQGLAGSFQEKHFLTY